MDFAPAVFGGTKGSASAGGGGAIAAVSNTLCVADPDGHFATVTHEGLEELMTYGEVARLDTSLVTVLKCILVTYFDVRDAKAAMSGLARRCESFPAADHDFRAVLVNMTQYAEKCGYPFGEFGEVAGASTLGADLLVEFYDMRAAQRLSAAAGTTATPVMPGNLGQAGGQNSAAARLSAHAGLAGFGSPTPAAAHQDRPAQSTSTAAALPLPASAGASAVEEHSPAANRPQHTKIPNKDFSKFDIDPEKIKRGQDARTTVMVRNLLGQWAQKDFLKFLESHGLSDRFTFFYMPCKEHRDVRAGFAFVNFQSAEDVWKLYLLVQGDAWPRFKRCHPRDRSCKPLAVSYARFQGHDELVTHFSSSVVMREQDPEKRPIFRPVTSKSAQPAAEAPTKLLSGPKASRDTAFASRTAPAAPLVAPPGLDLAQVPHGEAAVALGGPTELQKSLAEGVREIEKLLTQDMLPCYVQTAESLPYYTKTAEALPYYAQPEDTDCLPLSPLAQRGSKEYFRNELAVDCTQMHEYCIGA